MKLFLITLVVLSGFIARADDNPDKWENPPLKKNCFLMEKPDKKSKRISDPAFPKGATPSVTSYNQDWYKVMAPVEGFLPKSCFK
ncbi:MAG: hypothetical protein ACXWP5_14795 [Bdellovibrionota bacterium]